MNRELPGWVSLDAAHAPHVTLLQRFVQVKDLDAVTAAVAKVYAAQPPIGLELKAESLDYALWGGLAVTVFVVERTPDLMQSHEKTIEPFSVSGGTAAAFSSGATYSILLWKGRPYSESPWVRATPLSVLTVVAQGRDP
ncbi:MAG TPA: hypothetical protein VIX14_15015 [Terriglobales bacterium]